MFSHMLETNESEEQLKAPKKEFKGHSAWVELSRPNLEHNWNAIASIVGPDVTVIPMLKANAYGHGAVEVGKVLQESGARYAGVSTLGEAFELRCNGINFPLLVTDYVDPENLPAALNMNVALTVSHVQMFPEIEDTAKKLGKKAKVHVFKFPQKLFSFLDSLIPKNSSIPLFHELLTTTESELIFFMIIRQFRILLSLKEPANETIDEVKRMAPWQKSKLQKQASLFSKKKLVSLYNSLYEIELSQKTGFSAMSITDSIDFFLADL